MSRELLHRVIDELDDVVVPIILHAVRDLLAGNPLDRVLTQAERDTIAEYSQKRFDAALERSKSNMGG